MEEGTGEGGDRRGKREEGNKKRVLAIFQILVLACIRELSSERHS